MECLHVETGVSVWSVCGRGECMECLWKQGYRCMECLWKQGLVYVASVEAGVGVWSVCGSRGRCMECLEAGVSVWSVCGSEWSVYESRGGWHTKVRASCLGNYAPIIINSVNVD